MGWKFNWRKKVSAGPFYGWLTLRGLRSWGWEVGRWTHNVTHDTDSIDTPGPGSVSRRRRNR